MIRKIIGKSLIKHGFERKHGLEFLTLDFETSDGRVLRLAVSSETKIETHVRILPKDLPMSSKQKVPRQGNGVASR